MAIVKKLAVSCAALVLGLGMGTAAMGCKKDEAKAGEEAKKEPSKTDCQKAVDNLLKIVKADTSDMGKAMASKMLDEKPEELTKECDKEEAKKPGQAKCMAEASSLEGLMACDKD